MSSRSWIVCDSGIHVVPRIGRGTSERSWIAAYPLSQTQQYIYEGMRSKVLNTQEFNYVSEERVIVGELREYPSPEGNTT